MSGQYLRIKTRLGYRTVARKRPKSYSQKFNRLPAPVADDPDEEPLSVGITDEIPEVRK